MGGEGAGGGRELITARCGQADLADRVVVGDVTEDEISFWQAEVRVGQVGGHEADAEPGCDQFDEQQPLVYLAPDPAADTDLGEGGVVEAAGRPVGTDVDEPLLGQVAEPRPWPRRSRCGRCVSGGRDVCLLARVVNRQQHVRVEPAAGVQGMRTRVAEQVVAGDERACRV
jgi:hypothetical protein